MFHGNKSDCEYNMVLSYPLTILFIKNIPPPQIRQHYPLAAPESLLSPENYNFLAISSKRIVVLKRCDFTPQNATLPHSALLIHRS